MGGGKRRGRKNRLRADAHNNKKLLEIQRCFYSGCCSDYSSSSVVCNDEFEAKRLCSKRGAVKLEAKV